MLEEHNLIKPQRGLLRDSEALGQERKTRPHVSVERSGKEFKAHVYKRRERG